MGDCPGENAGACANISAAASGCASVARLQREQRAVLRSLRLVAVPISLQVFRPAGF
jgi:hypothetical protein